MLEYRASDGANLDSLLRSYFRLEEDLADAHRELASIDEPMAELVEKYHHLRVLHQPDPWECTVAFICSATNSVTGTRNRVEGIARELGQPKTLDSETRYSFPAPGRVVACAQRLQKMQLGLQRDEKVVEAARRICSGKLDLNLLADPGVAYTEARWQLQSCRGIGPKVADCISLFALQKAEAFPVDRWVREAIKHRYFDDEPVPFGDALVRWGQERFGRNAGYASQLLFLSAYLRSKNP